VPPHGRSAGAHQQQNARKRLVKTVEAAVIGVGWVGGTRAETLSRTALVDKLHLCDIKPDRLAEMKALCKPATATANYQDIIDNPNISVVYISTTPETNHYPIAKDCLKNGKNVMLEKPIALELWEADELIMLAKRNNLKFTIGYSQRFNTKIAYAWAALSRCWSAAICRAASARRSPAASACRRW
jgi:predicted dehydrogenase